MVKRTEAPIDYNALRLDSFSHGERSDCAVIAIALACNVPYKEAHAALARLGRKSKRGTRREHTLETVKAFGFHLRKWTFQEHSEMMLSYPKPHRFNCKYITSHHPRRFPKAWEKAHGTLLLFSSRHVLCAKRGEVLDWSINNALKIGEIYDVAKK